MNNHQFIQRAIYHLKRDFSDVVDFYTTSKGSLNVSTGSRTITKTKYKITQAIVLDAVSALKFLGQKIGVFDKETRFFIVEHGTYVPGKDDYCIYKHKRYKIEEIKSFEFDKGYLIRASETPLEKIEEIHNGYLTQTLLLSDVVEGEV